jgi:glycerophosphoryl diester phosphodiesterase
MNVSLATFACLFALLGCQGIGQTSELEEVTSTSQVRQENAHPVEIIAHRGASYDAPENTLASVKLAWEQNADAVEIDVWLTKDQQIVLMHDKTPKRYGGPDTPVSEMTLAQLRDLDVGAWKDPRWAGEKVPLLAEVLPIIPEGKRLFVEIKCGPEILPPLQTVLEESKIPSERVVLISFSDEVMKLAARRFPELECYWIVGIKRDKLTQQPSKSAESILNTFDQIGVSGLDLGGDSSLFTEAYLAEIRRREIPWYVWTINSIEEAKRLRNLDVRGITTDRPGYLKAGLQPGK